jgi:transposase
MHLARQWAELLAHVQQTNSQDHGLALGQKMADQANRAGVAERCADPAVHKSSAVDLALISDDDERLRDVDRTLLNTATHHDANTLYLLQTVPGIGTILSLVWRYELHAIKRFPTVQDVVSYGRLVTCAQESAGKRWGTAGATIGQAHLTWACSEAAVVFLRDHPPAQTDLARVEHTQDQGQAVTVLAHQLARAVYDMRTRHVAFEPDQVFPHAWRGADEPGASLDTQGMHLPDALDTAASRASLHAQARIGRETLSPAR